MKFIKRGMSLIFSLALLFCLVNLVNAATVGIYTGTGPGYYNNDYNGGYYTGGSHYSTGNHWYRGHHHEGHGYVGYRGGHGVHGNHGVHGGHGAHH